MTRSRWWVLGGAVVAVLVLLLGWLLLVNPTRNQAAALRLQSVDLEQQNVLLRGRIAQLQAQASALPEKQAELDQLTRQAPPAPDLPELIRQLSAIADQTGVNLDSLTPTPPAPLAVANTAAPAPAPTDTAVEPTAATTPPQVGPPAATTMQEIGVALSASGEFANLQLFIGRLETMERLFLTRDFSIGRGGTAVTTGGNNLSLTLNGSVFMLPGLPTVLPTPTPSVPSGDTSVVPLPTVSAASGVAPASTGPLPLPTGS